jgi:excinuclease ABC subunit C
MADPDSPEQPAKLFDIEAFLKTLTTHPGVYRMLDHQGQILYIGKALNLRNRVSSYFRGMQSVKTQALVSRIARIEVTVTLSETEALLLEQTLIKAHRPPFNILLRDDKSYPYILLSDHAFPRLSYYRGARRGKGRYFGPYPGASGVKDTLNLLQKLFRVRQCEDSFFANRARPCLQHQIGRCTAPCVDLISPQQYAEDVRLTVLFLEGRSREVTAELTRLMEAAADRLDYESAARYRDRIAAITQVQEQQFVEAGAGSADVFGVEFEGGVSCVQVIFVRAGRVTGSRSFIQPIRQETSCAELLDAFLPQFYIGQGGAMDWPAEIIIPEAFDHAAALAAALTEQAGQRIRVIHRVRQHRQAWLRLAQTNALEQLRSHLRHRETQQQRMQALAELLELNASPERLECFDISHTQGQGTVASCVVFDQNGPRKTDYRRFNIEGITPGDDYAAMAQALRRRYTRLKKGEAPLPDVLLIDGGKGQLQQAEQVLAELEIAGVMLVGVAKGVTRKAGMETLFRPSDTLGLILPGHSPALHLIQHIRDEAHRFAITGHRARRAKASSQSSLEQLPGIGPTRRRHLLNHFGGLAEVRRASVLELARVKGISLKMAEEIYAALREA